MSEPATSTSVDSPNLAPLPPFHPCIIVLLRPRIAANVGAVARIMGNFGLHKLVLVQPHADKNDLRARRLSTNCEHILEQAQIVGDLGEAVADCGMVVGTSARLGGHFRRQSSGSPEEIMPKLASADMDRPVALVFGPEATGMTNEEVSRCHYLIHIPTDPAHPALNLAQAVAICLYELRRWQLRFAGASEQTEPPASFAEQERMFARLRAALEKIHFLYGPNADALFHALRHLIGRAKPTSTEVDILLGLARQIEWHCDRESLK